MGKLTGSFDEREQVIRRKHAARPEFSRPLRFGDAEQIRALNEWRRDLQRLEEDRENANGGEIGEYEVTYYVLTRRRATVVASSADEAEDVLKDDEPGVENIENVELVGPGEGEPRIVEDYDL